MTSLRPYTDADADVFRSLIAELQDSLRAIVPELPAGADMADAYLTYTFNECSKWGGHIILAESDGEVVGFATVITQAPFTNPDEPPGSFAYLMDLVVRERLRGLGIGAALLDAAERAALDAGAKDFRTLVLHGNNAINLYRRAGMKDYAIILRKVLTADG